NTFRRSRESGDPGLPQRRSPWIPAFAGMTAEDLARSRRALTPRNEIVIASAAKQSSGERAVGCPGLRRRQCLLAMTENERGNSAREIKVERGGVDVGELGHVGERHALVDLVHGEADQAELGDRAEMMDEARVRRAAGGGELRRAAGDALDRGREHVA